jgi:hypothetical protein
MKTKMALSAFVGILMVGGAMAQWDDISDFNTILGIGDGYGIAADHAHEDVPAVAYVFSGSVAYSGTALLEFTQGDDYGPIDAGIVRWDDERGWVFNETTQAWTFTAASSKGTADTEAIRIRNVIDPTATATAATIAISGYGNCGSGWGENASYSYMNDNGTTTMEIEGGSSAGGYLPTLSPWLDNVGIAATEASASADGTDNAFVARSIPYRIGEATSPFFYMGPP